MQRFLTQAAVFLASAAFLTSEGLAQDNGWQFEVSPYLWGSDISGTVAAAPGLPPLDVDASFSDILENLEIGAMIAGTARKGRLGLMGDLQYVKLGGSGSTPGDLFSGGSYDVNLFVLTLGAESVIAETAQGELRLLGAARRWHVDTDITLTPGVAAGRRISGSDTWWDGLVGLRGRFNLSDRSYLAGTALIGAGGSDFTTDVFAGVGYALSDTAALVSGYRYLSTDRHDGDFIYDVEQQGIMLGVTLTFP